MLPHLAADQRGKHEQVRSSSRSGSYLYSPHSSPIASDAVAIAEPLGRPGTGHGPQRIPRRITPLCFLVVPPEKSSNRVPGQKQQTTQPRADETGDSDYSFSTPPRCAADYGAEEQIHGSIHEVTTRNIQTAQDYLNDVGAPSFINQIVHFLLETRPPEPLTASIQFLRGMLEDQTGQNWLPDEEQSNLQRACEESTAQFVDLLKDLPELSARSGVAASIVLWQVMYYTCRMIPALQSTCDLVWPRILKLILKDLDPKLKSEIEGIGPAHSLHGQFVEKSIRILEHNTTHSWQFFVNQNEGAFKALKLQDARTTLLKDLEAENKALRAEVEKWKKFEESKSSKYNPYYIDLVQRMGALADSVLPVENTEAPVSIDDKFEWVNSVLVSSPLTARYNVFLNPNTNIENAEGRCSILDALCCAVSYLAPEAMSEEECISALKATSTHVKAVHLTKATEHWGIGDFTLLKEIEACERSVINQTVTSIYERAKHRFRLPESVDSCEEKMSHALRVVRLPCAQCGARNNGCTEANLKLLQEAQRQYCRGAILECMETLNTVLESQPNHAPTLFRIAAVHHATGNFEEARKAYDKATKSDIEWHSGVKAVFTPVAMQASKGFRTVRPRSPGSSDLTGEAWELKDMLEKYHLGNEGRNAGESVMEWLLAGEAATNLSTRTECYTKAIEIDPTSTPALFRRANTKHTLGDFVGARRDYVMATCLDKQWHGGSKFRADAINEDDDDLLMDGERTAELHKCLNEYRFGDQFQSREVSNALLTASQQAETRFDKMGLLAAAVEKDETNPAARFALGTARHDSADFENARVDYVNATETSGARRRASRKAGLNQEEDYSSERVEYTEATQGYSVGQSVEEMVAELDKTLSSATDRRTRVASLTEKAFLLPFDKASHYELASLHAAEENYEEARNAYAAATQVDPEWRGGAHSDAQPPDAAVSPTALESFAVGDTAAAVSSNIAEESRALPTSEAFQQLDEALKIDPRSSHAFYVRAALHHTLGEFDEALRDYVHATKYNMSRPEKRWATPPEWDAEINKEFSFGNTITKEDLEDLMIEEELPSPQ